MTATAGRKITALRGDQVTLAEAADDYLSTNRVVNSNTHPAYASAIDRTVADLGQADEQLRYLPPEPGGESDERVADLIVSDLSHPAGAPITMARMVAPREDRVLPEVRAWFSRFDRPRHAGFAPRLWPTQPL